MDNIQTIYLVHHSHTDIGYAHDQPIVWEMDRRFIDTAIDACERHLDHDGDHACRWTVETVAPLLHWFQHSPDRQCDLFGSPLNSLSVTGGVVQLELAPRRMVVLRLEIDRS